MAEVQQALVRHDIRWKFCNALASPAMQSEVHVLVEEHYAADVECWFRELIHEVPFLPGTLLYVHSLERREALTDHSSLFASRRSLMEPSAVDESRSP